MSVSLYVDASVLNSTDEVIVEGRRTVNLRAGTNVAMTKSGYDDVVISSSSPTVAPSTFSVKGTGGSVVIPAVPGSKFPFDTSLSATGTGLTWNTTTYQTNEDVSGMGLNINISIVATPATIPGDLVAIRIRTNLGVLTGRFFDSNAYGNFTLTWNGVMPAGSGPMWINVYTTLDGTYNPGSIGTYLQVQRFY